MTVKTWDSIPDAIRALYPREGHIGCGELALDAADEIDRLERENEVLREQNLAMNGALCDNPNEWSCSCGVLWVEHDCPKRAADEKSARLSRCGCGGKAVCGVCGRQLPNVAADETRVVEWGEPGYAEGVERCLRPAEKTAAPPDDMCPQCGGGWAMPDEGCKACNNTGYKDGVTPVPTKSHTPLE